MTCLYVPFLYLALSLLKPPYPQNLLPPDEQAVEYVKYSLKPKKWTERGKMNSHRNYAIAAGILFIIADLVGFLSLPFIAPVNDTNYLVSVSTNANLVITAAL